MLTGFLTLSLRTGLFVVANVLFERICHLIGCARSSSLVTSAERYAQTQRARPLTGIDQHRRVRLVRRSVLSSIAHY